MGRESGGLARRGGSPSHRAFLLWDGMREGNPVLTWGQREWGIPRDCFTQLHPGENRDGAEIGSCGSFPGSRGFDHGSMHA